MQSLAVHKGQKLWRSNGSLHTLACHPPLSPGPQASQARAQLLHALSLDEGGPEPEPSLSDSSSGGSFGRSPGTGPGPFSSSLGHLNHLGGSLDRASRGPKEAGPPAVLSCLPEPPPPYEFSCSSAEEMGAVLPEACEELKRGLGNEDGSNPFTQVRGPLPWSPVLCLSTGVQARKRGHSQLTHMAMDTREQERGGWLSFLPLHPRWWGCHVTGGPCLGVVWEGRREAPWEGHVMGTPHPRGHPGLKRMCGWVLWCRGTGCDQWLEYQVELWVASRGQGHGGCISSP